MNVVPNIPNPPALPKQL
jgi:hypothetical protein